jgi:hypothetical protein
MPASVRNWEECCRLIRLFSSAPLCDNFPEGVSVCKMLLCRVSTLSSTVPTPDGEVSQDTMLAIYKASDGGEVTGFIARYERRVHLIGLRICRRASVTMVRITADAYKDIVSQRQIIATRFQPSCLRISRV